LDQSLIELVQTIGSLSGLDPLSSMIFGVVYLEPDAISLEDVAKKTGYSLASISNKVRFLENLGHLKRTHKPGTKKVFVYAEKDFRKILKEQLVKAQEVKIRLIKEKMPHILIKYKNKKLTEDEKKRLDILEDYYKQMLGFDGLIQDMLEKMEDKP